MLKAAAVIVDDDDMPAVVIAEAILKLCAVSEPELTGPVVEMNPPAVKLVSVTEFAIREVVLSCCDDNVSRTLRLAAEICPATLTPVPTVIPEEEVTDPAVITGAVTEPTCKTLPVRAPEQLKLETVESPVVLTESALILPDTNKLVAVNVVAVRAFVLNVALVMPVPLKVSVLMLLVDNELLVNVDEETDVTLRVSAVSCDADMAEQVISLLKERLSAVILPVDIQPLQSILIVTVTASADKELVVISVAERLLEIIAFAVSCVTVAALELKEFAVIEPLTDMTCATISAVSMTFDAVMFELITFEAVIFVTLRIGTLTEPRTVALPVALIVVVVRC